MNEAENGKVAGRKVIRTAYANLIPVTGAAIGCGAAALSMLFIQRAHEATGLPEWLIAPFAMASAGVPAWYLIRSIVVRILSKSDSCTSSDA